MWDLSTNDVSYVLKHLSHGLKIHENYCQLISDVIEKTKVDLLLTLKDNGKLEEFKGRKIEDITLEGKNFVSKEKYQLFNHKRIPSRSYGMTLPNSYFYIC